MNPYKRMIPKRYHRDAGFEKFASRLERPWGRPYTYLYRSGQVVPIAASASVNVHHSGRRICALVERQEAPPLYDAIIHLGEAIMTGVRTQRFTSAFKSYESISSTSDIHLAAIRHALSHPESVLSRPKTVAALNDLFGTTRVDLEIASHLRVFYTQMGRLLIAVDALIADAIVNQSFKWKPVPPGLSARGRGLCPVDV